MEIEHLPEQFTPPKKIKTSKNRAGRKRNKNSPLAPSRLYFNAGTQASIVKFQGTVSRIEQEKIYRYEILPAFEKLVENLINIHKFAAACDGFEQLRNDAIVFLYETLRKFDPSKGSNAFSYFNVVAKNWLIIKTKQKIQQNKRNVDLDDPESMTQEEIQIFEEKCTVECQDELPDQYKPREIFSVLTKIREQIITSNELLCINAIITLFENIDQLDLLTKNSTLLYLRELSGLNAKQLTIALQSIKKIYKQLKIDKLNCLECAFLE